MKLKPIDRIRMGVENMVREWDRVVMFTTITEEQRADAREHARIWRTILEFLKANSL